MSTQRNKRSTIVFLSLIAVSVLTASVGLYLSTAPLTQSVSDPAVIISLLGWSNGWVTRLRDDIAVSILITAPLPPDQASEEGVDTRIVYSGVARDGVVIPQESLADIIDGWVRLYTERRNDNMPHVGLINHVNVISVTSGSVIAAGMTSVTIDTGLISEGLVGCTYLRGRTSRYSVSILCREMRLGTCMTRQWPRSLTFSQLKIR